MSGPTGIPSGPVAAGTVSEVWFGNDHPALARCWHPVARLDGLDGDGPHPVRLLGRDLVLFRTPGSPPGWALLPDRCPHRLAPLTAGTVGDGMIRCAYHGWCFDGGGRCRSIPAIGDRGRIPVTAHLAPATVTERYGLLWAALDDPVTGLPEVPEWDDPAFGRVAMPQQEWRAGAAQMVDNFLDVAHFPFTHLGTIGDPDETVVGDCTVAHGDLSFTAHFEHSARVLDGSGAVTRRTMDFRCTAPHHLHLRLGYDDDVVVLVFFHQPVDATTTRLHCVQLATSLAGEPSGAEHAVRFQMQVAAEDRVILEQLRTDAVPLHPGAEVHTRADRTTVAYRRLLSELVGSTGGPR